MLWLCFSLFFLLFWRSNDLAVFLNSHRLNIALVLIDGMLYLFPYNITASPY